MQRRALGRTGLRVSRLGLGTMTWGGDTDEHEAREQLTVVPRRRREPRRHRRRLHRRALRGAARLAARHRGPPRRGRRRHQGRDLAPHRHAGPRHLARHPAQPRWTPRSSGSGSTTSTSGRCTSGPTRPRSRRPWRALDFAVSTGRAAYVGISNYNGWQTGQAATWQRAVPGRNPLASTQVEYSLVNRQHRARGAAGGPCARAGRAALVAARPRRAHRASTAAARRRTPAARRGSSASFVDAYLDDRGRGIVEATVKAADGLGWTPLQVALVLGARPARRHRAHRRRPHRGPAPGRAGHRGQVPAGGDRLRAR